MFLSTPDAPRGPFGMLEFGDASAATLASMPAALTSQLARLLHSFQSVALENQHRNAGERGPYLRDFGFHPGVAQALIRWGTSERLVCTLQSADSASPHIHCWKPHFLVTAGQTHLRLFGAADLPAAFLHWVRSEALQGSAKPRRVHPARLANDAPAGILKTPASPVPPQR